MNGIIPIDKPAGFTSFDVIAKLRGILKTRKIGHSGTLDPLATGVLPIFVGRAAKAADMLTDPEKRYEAKFKLGELRDTEDISGEIIKTTDVKISESELRAVLDDFTGKISQIPPMYSAVKINGRRLYELAREGKTVERQPREIEIFNINLDYFDENSQTGKLSVSCSKGTYIRTLICDIAKKAGSLGTMTELRRTYSQGFDILSCLTLSDIENAAAEGNIGDILIPTDRCFENYNEIHLSDRLEGLYRNGVKLRAAQIGSPADGIYRIYGREFLGIAKIGSGELKTVKNFFGDD